MAWWDWFQNWFGEEKDRSGTWETPPETPGVAPDQTAAPMPGAPQGPDLSGVDVVDATPQTPADPSAPPLSPTEPMTPPGPASSDLPDSGEPGVAPSASDPLTPPAKVEFAAALTEQDLTKVTEFLGVDLPELWTIVTVETRGYGFWSDRVPPILFERHYFHQLTAGAYDQRAPDISNSKWGGYGRSSEQYGRLRRAAFLDYDAALKSASWGIGQVMGANAEDLGYSSVQEFVLKMRQSEGEQLMAMARFLDDRNLITPLRRHDWATVARRYNGPSYAKNNYDTRMAQAYTNLADGRRLPDWNVRQAQLYLAYFGLLDTRGVDGVIGRMTRAALKQFYERIGHRNMATSSLKTVPKEMLADIEAEVSKLETYWPMPAPGEAPAMV